MTTYIVAMVFVLINVYHNITFQRCHLYHIRHKFADRKQKVLIGL